MTLLTTDKMHAGRQPQNLIIREEKQMKLDELPLYDFEKLEIATNYFHFGNMLGNIILPQTIFYNLT
jgi:hypothetical protein